MKARGKQKDTRQLWLGQISGMQSVAQLSYKASS